MKIKKAFSFVLACLSVATVFFATSCKDEAETKTDGTETHYSADYPEYLKDKTYDGDTVTFLVATEAHGEFFSEEDDANNVNNAIYNRNLKVMERHEVELEYVASDGPTVMQNTILSIVQAGEQTIDLFAPSYWWIIGNEGIAFNLNDIDVFHFDEPWWYQGWNDVLTYSDGRMYYCTGAVNLLTFSSSSVIYMNKTIFEDISAGSQGMTLDELYQLVLDGGWTREVMLQYVMRFGGDINADGVMDDNDTYGHVTTFGSLTHQLGAWGVRLTYTEEDGYYEWNFLTKSFLEKYETYGQFMSNSHTTTTNDWISFANDAFMAGNILFVTTPLNNYNVYRHGEADYTILPLTKYDENQKNYRTVNGAILNAIPACLENSERAAVILEALNYENYQSVIPEIKEITLKNKIADDEGTKKMLDVIYESVDTEFAFVHNEKLKLWSTVMTGTNPQIVSTYMSNRDMFDERLNEILNNES